MEGPDDDKKKPKPCDETCQSEKVLTNQRLLEHEAYANAFINSIPGQ